MAKDLSNFDKWWPDAHFVSYLFYCYCTNVDMQWNTPKITHLHIEILGLDDVCNYWGFKKTWCLKSVTWNLMTVIRHCSWITVIILATERQTKDTDHFLSVVWSYIFYRHFVIALRPTVLIKRRSSFQKSMRKFSWIFSNYQLLYKGSRKESK